VTIEERVAALEISVAQVRNKLGMNSQPADSLALRGVEDVPAQLVTIGFSRDRYLLRAERYRDEPIADRLVSRGDLRPTMYRWDSDLAAWQNAEVWERAGKPSRDADGRMLDVRGRPL
jgi:hypothetical protein